MITLHCILGHWHDLRDLCVDLRPMTHLSSYFVFVDLSRPMPTVIKLSPVLVEYNNSCVLHRAILNKGPHSWNNQTTRT